MSLNLDEIVKNKPKPRGKGRGGNFMVMGRENLETLVKAQTSNRMNFILTYCVLLAGTGADHKLTKWSAKACEEKLGIGRPRAKLAIAELVKSGLMSLAPDFNTKRPQYLLAPPSKDIHEIFLPVPLVTGLNKEPSVLRRLKETNNPLLVKILLSIYRDVIVDRTYSLPLATLQVTHGNGNPSATKVIETGIFSLWHLPKPHTQTVDRAWVGSIFGTQDATGEMFSDFWDGLKALRNTGALITEDWVFDSNAPDAEPLFPIDLEEIYYTSDSEPAKLTETLLSTAYNFVAEKEYLLDQFSDGLLIPLPSHCSAPAIRGVFKPRIEPDSPGRRMSYAKRMQATAHFLTTFKDASSNFANQQFNQPFSLLPPESTA